MSRYVRYLLVVVLVGGLSLSAAQLAATQDSVSQVSIISGSDFTWIFAAVKIEDIVMCENGTEAWAVGIGPGPFDDALLFKITGVDTANPSVDQDSFIGFPDPYLDGPFPAGMGPRGFPGLAVDFNCEFAYLPNFFLDSVAKVDLSSGEIVWPADYTAETFEDLRTVPSPVDAQLTADGARVVVSNSSTGEVTVLDTSTGSTLATVSTGGVGPGGISLLDALLLSVGEDTAPEGVDGASVDVGGFDVSYYWTADGEQIGETKTAYITFSLSLSFDKSGLLHLSADSSPDIEEDAPEGANGIHLELVTQVPVPVSLAWTKGGEALGDSQQMTVTALDFAVTASPRAAVVESGDVACVDLSTDSLIGPITGLGINPFMAVASSDGSRLYVSNTGSNSVTVLEGIGCDKSVAATVEVGNAPRHLALSSDDRFLYVSNSTDNTVSVIDTGSLSVVETIQVTAAGEPAPVGVVAVSKDNRYLYVFWEGGPKGTPGTFQLFVYDVSGLYGP